jgi:hypothetical protein
MQSHRKTDPRVEPTRWTPECHLTFDPFWYSLDLFLPLSTLPDAEIWAPKEGDRFRSIYSRVHSVLGWILIPIGLAVITGVISGK